MCVIALHLSENWPGLSSKSFLKMELVREARSCLMSSTPVLDEHKAIQTVLDDKHARAYHLFFEHGRA